MTKDPKVRVAEWLGQYDKDGTEVTWERLREANELSEALSDYEAWEGGRGGYGPEQAFALGARLCEQGLSSGDRDATVDGWDGLVAALRCAEDL